MVLLVICFKQMLAINLNACVVSDFWISGLAYPYVKDWVMMLKCFQASRLMLKAFCILHQMKVSPTSMSSHLSFLFYNLRPFNVLVFCHNCLDEFPLLTLTSHVPLISFSPSLNNHIFFTRYTIAQNTRVLKSPSKCPCYIIWKFYVL